MPNTVVHTHNKSFNLTIKFTFDNLISYSNNPVTLNDVL